MNDTSNNKKSDYALYHGDDFIDIGSRKYLAALINVKEKTISFYSTPIWLKRTNYKSWVVIRIED